MASISPAVGQRGFLFVPIPSLPSGICDTPSSLESLKEPLADALVLQILPAGLMAVIDRATRMVGEALYLQLVWALPVDHLSPFSRLLVVEGLLRVLYASFPRVMDGPSVALVIFPPDLVGDYLPIQNLAGELDVLFLQQSFPCLHQGLSSLPSPTAGSTRRCFLLTDAPWETTPKGLVRAAAELEAREQQLQEVWRANEACKEAAVDTVGCVGGTFDHLHHGHKILLTISAMTCRKLEFGVTAPVMLEKKLFPEFMQSAEERVANSTAFLRLINPALVVNLTLLVEPFGPILTVPEMRFLVLSQETSSSIPVVNARRHALGFAPLYFLVIGLTSPASDYFSQSGHTLELPEKLSLKISSTQIRKRLSQRQLSASI